MPVQASGAAILAGPGGISDQWPESPGGVEVGVGLVVDGCVVVGATGTVDDDGGLVGVAAGPEGWPHAASVANTTAETTMVTFFTTVHIRASIPHRDRAQGPKRPVPGSATKMAFQRVVVLWRLRAAHQTIRQ